MQPKAPRFGRFPMAVLLLAFVSICGCEDLSPGVEPIAEENEKAGSQQTPAADSQTPSGIAPGAGSQSPSASQADRVQLRTGVALAQTLPTGTCMTFSVEYDFQLGPPDASCKYFLVVESGQGQPFRHPIQVKQSGTIQAIAPSLRPDNGPFSCYLEEEPQSGEKQKISQSISMR